MTLRESRPNRFLVLEGIDGSGKTTIAHMLVDRLKARGTSAAYTEGIFPPYETPRRQIYENAHPQASYFYYLSAVCFASARIAQMLQDHWVVCDRYVYTTEAYHQARGVTPIVPYGTLGLLMPDRAFHIIVPDIETAATRVRARNSARDKPTDKPIDSTLGARVLAAYSAMELHPIDNGGNAPEPAVDQIMAAIAAFL